MQRRKAEEINEEEAVKEEHKKTAEKVNRRQPESLLCSQSQCSESLESRVDGRRRNRRRRRRMVEMEQTSRGVKSTSIQKKHLEKWSGTL